MADIQKLMRMMGPADMTLDGLAWLEKELLEEYPEAQARIAQTVAEFTPVAQQIERRHDGRRLMVPVQARRNRDWRASKNFLLSAVSFFIVLLPACAFGISLRGRWDFDAEMWWVASLLATTAALCVLKVLSTLRDRVWAGVPLRWAIGAAVISALTAFLSFNLGIRIPGDESGVPLAVIPVSTMVIVAFTGLAIFRQVRAARMLAADLAEVQPAVDSYVAEFGREYDRALARITAALKTIDVEGTVDPKNQRRLKQQRDGAISALAGNRGLYQGHVPLFVSRKKLGELQLLAVAEPLLGGGQYPVRGRKPKYRPVTDEKV